MKVKHLLFALILVSLLLSCSGPEPLYAETEGVDLSEEPVQVNGEFESFVIKI